ncbi:MAG: DUF6941 family protein [Planctomycetia bacterium]
MDSANEPYPLALVLCDSVHRDPDTRKYFLLGCFSDLPVQQLPAQFRMGVYLAVTNVTRKLNIRVPMTSPSGAVLFDVDGEMEMDDPRGVADVGFTVEDLQFDQPGEYTVVLLADGVPLVQRKLNVFLVD